MGGLQHVEFAVEDEQGGVRCDQIRSAWNAMPRRPRSPLGDRHVDVGAISVQGLLGRAVVEADEVQPAVLSPSCEPRITEEATTLGRALTRQSGRGA